MKNIDEFVHYTMCKEKIASYAKGGKVPITYLCAKILKDIKTISMVHGCVQVFLKLDNISSKIFPIRRIVDLFGGSKKPDSLRKKANQR